MDSKKFTRIAFACVFTCFFPFLKSNAQNWSPLPNNNTLQYSFSQAGSTDLWLMALHADSVKQEGGDNAYYLYRIDRKPLSIDSIVDCNGQPIELRSEAILTNQDHFMGQKMLAKPTGECQFISTRGDTFSLFTLANAGFTWTSANGISVIVDSVVAGNVLGAADSLKYFHLSSGPNWILSKVHGLVQWSNLQPFADLTGSAAVLQMEIWGIPTLGLGEQLPQFGEIMQFDVGDRFGIRTLTDFFPGLFRTWKEWDILALTPGSYYDYGITVESLTYHTPFSGPVDTTYSAPTASTLSFDTFSLAYLELLPYQTQPVIPGFFGASCQVGFHRSAAWNARIQMDFDLKSDYDTCAQAHFNSNAAGHQNFATGLGETSYAWITVTDLRQRDLYCYQKGLESWGTCADLGTLDAVAESLEGSYSLSPNPAAQKIHLKLDEQGRGLEHKMSIQTLDGRQLRVEQIPAGVVEWEIDVDGLAVGMYLLGLEAVGFVPAHLRFVVVR